MNVYYESDDEGYVLFYDADREVSWSARFALGTQLPGLHDLIRQEVKVDRISDRLFAIGQDLMSEGFEQKEIPNAVLDQLSPNSPLGQNVSWEISGVTREDISDACQTLQSVFEGIDTGWSISLERGEAGPYLIIETEADVSPNRYYFGYMPEEVGMEFSDERLALDSDGFNLGIINAAGTCIDLYFRVLLNFLIQRGREGKVVCSMDIPNNGYVHLPQEKVADLNWFRFIPKLKESLHKQGLLGNGVNGKALYGNVVKTGKGRFAW